MLYASTLHILEGKAFPCGRAQGLGRPLLRGGPRNAPASGVLYTPMADITPHTLRHTFASLAGDLGFSELTIGALLGHSARGVTQRYIHIDEALRMTADRVAAEMADILDGRATPARTRGDRAERRLEAAGS